MVKSHRERDDNYRYVLMKLDDKWRLIAPVDGSQYILQYRASPDRWTGKKFFAYAREIPKVVKEVVGDHVDERTRAWASRAF